MQDTTFLFTDIEGSTRLWEEQPELMRPALAAHDAFVREIVERHRGEVVKTTGDGVHAAFESAADALRATLALQSGIARAIPAIELRIRCGLHAGPAEVRDGDYFGGTVNRAARIMSAAHGGQVLLSAAVAERAGASLPAGAGLRDLGAVRLRDLSDAERVFQLLHPDLRAEFPALRSLERTPNNLPHEFTSFIGRERELVTLDGLLREHRLVTIVGMGGMGKSRLATHVAAEALDDFLDGAWLVELASIHDPSLVPLAIASVLGVSEEPGRPVIEALSRYLASRSALLVLDNCEHLTAAAARAARTLLEAAPGLRILATSRETLQLGGEAVFPLSSLAFPGPLAAEGMDLPHYDAVQLFVERAAAASPGFELTAATRPQVAAICNRLDGIPLALELAAARVRSIPIAQLASRLHDKFRLLRSADPTALPRQRTLLALIDWSHDLLDDEERVVFRRCAIFAAGWSLESAEQVCPDPLLDADIVPDVLARLVEKSLVALDRKKPRYAMLETVREYALAKLAEADEREATRRRHFAHFLGFAQAAARDLVGPEQGHGLARLDGERENLLAAHAGAGAEESHEGLALVSALKHYWINRGLLEVGERVTHEALARAGAGATADARCRALFDLGQLRYFMGQYANARSVLEESLAIARKLGVPRKIEAVLQPLGMAALAQGDVAMARDCLMEALVVARALQSPRDVSTAANMLGQVMRVEGAFARAGELFAETIALSRAAGDGGMVAVGLLNQAMVAVQESRFPAARAAIAEAWSIARELQSRPLEQSALEVTAGLAIDSGDPLLAARLFGAAEAESTRTRLRRDAADAAFLMPRVAAIRQALGLDGFTGACDAGRTRTLAESRAEALRWLAMDPVRPPSPCHSPP